ncbi:MAG: HTH-type transcriptional regulator CymR [Phycisphaerae bacterium]|nr:HTH-type transcriptional regulator CymR [Phycisphaerae bacterium]
MVQLVSEPTVLALTRKTEYGVIALCELARRDGELGSAREIASRHCMPLTLLMNVLKTLTQRGLVRSVRGARGGYALARAADQISLHDVVDAIEGPVRLVRCVDHPAAVESCELRGSCQVRAPMLRVHEKLRTFLDAITIADIATDASTADGVYHQLTNEVRGHAVHLS